MAASRFTTVLAVAATLAAATAACGARNDLELADAASAEANGAAAGTAASSSSGAGGSVASAGAGASGGGSSDVCAGLLVADPGPVIVASQPGAADPQVAWYPDGETFLLGFTAPFEGAPPSFHGMDFDASGPWPPSHGVALPLFEMPDGYALASGPQGPVALVGSSTDSNLLAVQLAPDSVTLDAAPFPDGHPLFAAAIEGRYFYGSRQTLAAYDRLQVGSYQPDSLPQSEDPDLCVSTTLVAAGVPASGGFLGAYGMVDPALPECTPEGGMATSVGLYRYDSPPGLGSNLEETPGDRFTPIVGDPLVHLEMAATSFGAWVVWQNAGLTAEVQPPPMALRVDDSGRALVSGDPGIALTDIGWGGPLAVSVVGDTLVAAWTDSSQPSAPLVVVQLVRADGTFGPSTSIPSDPLWLTGPLRVLGQPGGDRIFVTWEGGLDATHVALARIDCVSVDR
ncbi:MAG: hypothetical protein WKG00_01670 [Polyangiaceae bacterium]